jgi:MoxR-like ATPase
MTDADTNPETTGVTAKSRPTNEEALSIETTADLAERIVENVEQVIVGNDDTVEHMVTTVLACGHLLLEDVPGVGKTMLARAVARSVDCSFKRVQFTPDLLPSDVTGANVFNQKSREFEFNPGPIFANVVLGDEINRAPPKTQSALLEAMEENQVTVDGDTYPVPEPFTVIATQNAVEPNQTYELPIAEVDRFTKKLSLGYPDPEEESEVLARIVGRHPIETLDPVATADDLIRARRTVSEVHVEDSLRAYVTRLANYTREQAALGVSPRGSITLLRAAQARAAVHGREYVIPDDVKAEARPVWSHRVKFDDSRGIGGDAGLSVVEDALDSVPVE